MISDNENNDNTEAFEQSGHESGCKLGSSVGEDLLRESMKAELFSNEVVGSAIRVNLFGAWYGGG